MLNWITVNLDRISISDCDKNDCDMVAINHGDNNFSLYALTNLLDNQTIVRKLFTRIHNIQRVIFGIINGSIMNSKANSDKINRHRPWSCGYLVIIRLVKDKFANYGITTHQKNRISPNPVAVRSPTEKRYIIIATCSKSQ